MSTFAWTFSYALLSVVLTFFAGLFIAIALNHPGLRFQRVQRSILILPYAIPAFLSLLVWRGLLNDDFGVVNSILPVDVPWLFDPWWARVSCLLVNFWLGIPYMFLICTGALQSIPGEMTEAARVDGASGLQVFRKLTLPLLFAAVAPLLIASFAFNFNNFNAIYFLTEGGPYSEEQSVAGSTDILVSYTYKVAFQTGRGGDYGLAASLSILIFLLVAAISAISFIPHQVPGEPRVTAGAESTPAPVSAAERASRPRSRPRRGSRPRRRSRAAAVPRGLVALPRRPDRDGVRPLPRRVHGLGRIQPGAVLSTASVIPEGVTLDNFRAILSDPQEPYPNWYLEHDDHRDRDRGRDRPPGRARRVLVLAASASRAAGSGCSRSS